MKSRLAFLFSVLAIAGVTGCNNGGGGSDSGPPVDGGGGVDTGMVTPGMCPTNMIPDPTNQMGACCYRASQASHLDTPSLRLRYLNIRQPAGSALTAAITQTLLNGNLGTETFNWIFTTTGAGMDGPVSIRTGVATRNMDGTYTYSTDPRYAPVTLMGTLTGETVTTTANPGTLVVPIYDQAGTTLQIELSLHNVRLETATLSEMRSCIGSIGARFMFNTAATLRGFLTVADTRAGMINVSSIHAQLCTLVASANFSDPMGGPAYCDQPQAMWTVQPDSLCPADGSACMRNGTTNVCDPAGTSGTLPACNAWELVADFAAVGINVTP
jgi:hypothetical protein